METNETLEFVVENPILVSVVIPTAAAGIALIAARPIRRLPGIIAIVASFAGVVASILLAAKAFSGPLSAKLAPTAWSLPIGGQSSMPGWQLALTFNADALAATMAIGFSLLFFVAALVSYDLRKTHDLRAHYYFFLLLAGAGANGIALAGDLLTLYIAWELMTLAGAALVLVPLRAENASAARKLLITSFATSIPMSAAVIWLLMARGSLDIGELAARPVSLDSSVAMLAGLAFLATFVVRAGLIPFHTWLIRAADSAIGPASLILTSALTMAGAYSIVRVALSTFSLDTNWAIALGGLGTISAVLGPIGAMRSIAYRRTLAYLAIGQIGLIFIPLALANPVGYAAALSQLVGFAVYFPLLIIANSLLRRLPIAERRFSEVVQKAPAAFLALVIGLLGIAAVPPLNGFAPRVLAYQALLDAGNTASLLLLAAAFLATALTAAAAIDLLSRAASSQVETREPGESSNIGAKAAIAILTVLSLGLGIVPHLVLADLIQPLVAAARGIPTVTTATQQGAWVVVAAPVLLAAAIALGSATYLRQRGLLENPSVPYAHVASKMVAPVPLLAPVFRALGFIMERNFLDVTPIFEGALSVAAGFAHGVIHVLATGHAPDPEAVWDYEEEEENLEEPRIAA